MTHRRSNEPPPGLVHRPMSARETAGQGCASRSGCPCRDPGLPPDAAVPVLWIVLALRSYGGDQSAVGRGEQCPRRPATRPAATLCRYRGVPRGGQRRHGALCPSPRPSQRSPRTATPPLTHDNAGPPGPRSSGGRAPVAAPTPGAGRSGQRTTTPDARPHHKADGDRHHTTYGAHRCA